MRSDRTVAEFEAQAMLMGPRYEYDMWDHTFCEGEPNGVSFDDYLCADTLEVLNYGDGTTWPTRKKMVKAGELGAADALDIIRQAEGCEEEERAANASKYPHNQ